MPRFRLKDGDHSGRREPLELEGGVVLFDLPGRDEGIAALTDYTTALVDAGLVVIVDPDENPPDALPLFDPIYMLRGSDPPELVENMGGGVLVPVSLADVNEIAAAVAALLDPNDLAAAIASISGRFRGDWTATTAYHGNDVVRRPGDGVLIARTADGASRASFDSTEAALWTVALTVRSGGVFLGDYAALDGAAAKAHDLVLGGGSLWSRKADGAISGLLTSADWDRLDVGTQSIILYDVPGPLAVAGSVVRAGIPVDMTILGFMPALEEDPNRDVVADVNYAPPGVNPGDPPGALGTLYSDPTDRPRVAAGRIIGDVALLTGGPVVARQGGYLTVDVDEAGTGTAPEVILVMDQPRGNASTVTFNRDPVLQQAGDALMLEVQLSVGGAVGDSANQPSGPNTHTVIAVEIPDPANAGQWITHDLWTLFLGPQRSAVNTNAIDREMHVLKAVDDAVWQSFRVRAVTPAANSHLEAKLTVVRGMPDGDPVSAAAIWTPPLSNSTWQAPPITVVADQSLVLHGWGFPSPNVPPDLHAPDGPVPGTPETLRAGLDTFLIRSEAVYDRGNTGAKTLTGTGSSNPRTIAYSVAFAGDPALARPGRGLVLTALVQL